jgi:ABC-type uncharacterized transport system involved in gliding motility auxiliary subunit
MEWLKRLSGPLGLALILVGGVTYGILYTSGWIAILPLLVGVALVVVAVVVNLRGARTEGARRSARLGVNAAVSIIVFAAILVFLQTLSARHNAQYDTTANKRFSLSPQTEKILGALTKDVVVTCFFKEAGPGRRELQDLLKQYSSESHRVKYEFIDPDKDPVAARRYQVTSYGTIVVESGGNEEKVMEVAEEKLTNAILKVTREKRKVIYCVTGHGEKSIDDTQAAGLSQLKSAVEAENYELKDLFTLRDSIPKDCEMLLIPGPEKDLFPEERIMIERYLAAGGKLLMLVDPLTELPQVDSLAAAYGIEITNSIIIDRFGKILAGNYFTPVVNKYGSHPITEGFRLASFFPQARALEITAKRPEGLSVTVLASTGGSAYAERNIPNVLKGKTQFESDQDLPGPVNVAEVATKDIGPKTTPGAAQRESPKSRVVVFGDSDFTTNAYIGLSGNKDLILNTISWLAEEADLIAIRAKNPVSQPVVLVTRQGRVIFWLPVVGLPALFIVLGIIVLVHRRRAA